VSGGARKQGLGVLTVELAYRPLIRFAQMRTAVNSTATPITPSGYAPVPWEGPDGGLLPCRYMQGFPG
jgi:hypothetical protein